MFKINIQNVEKIIFENNDVWKDLTDLIHLKDQWQLSRISPILRAMGKKALLDFLNSRIKYGLSEFLSVVYNGYTMAALLNLIDFLHTKNAIIKFVILTVKNTMECV